MVRPAAVRHSTPFLFFLSALVACETDSTAPPLGSDERTSDRPAAAAAAAGAVVLVGAGDIAGSGSDDEETAKLLDQVVAAEGSSVTVFTAGDNAYPDGTDSNFVNYYDPTWGRHKAITRPSPGNHDYHTPGAAGYFNYFGASAGPPGVGYYSYDVGDWHIISLNSEISMSAGSPQEQWLRADLAATTLQCVLAYWHKPRFSSGDHGSSTGPRPLWEALYDANAEIVVSGHDHTYERFAPQTPDGTLDPEGGIRQFVAGTGGAGLYSISNPLPNSEAHNDQAKGVLKLTLYATGYDWEFIPIAGETYTDVGSDTCHGVPSSPPTVDAGNSTVATDASSVPADGSSSATITVTLLDGAGAPVEGHTVSLTQGGGSSAISAPSGPSDASGQVTFTVTNTTAETVTYTATDVTEWVTITQTTQVTFDPLPTDAGNSTVATDASNVLANGTSSATITVTLLTEVNAPVVGHTVSLTQGGGSSSISAPSGPSDANGLVTFTVTNTTEETVTYTATDVTDGITIAQTAQVTFVPVPIGGDVIDVRVAASSDDAEERADRSMYRTSSDLEMVYDGGDQTVGIRFTGVAIPQGAWITNAYVQFQVDETPSASTSLTVQGEAADNAVTFGTADGDISSRDRTGAAVPWTPPAWSNRGEAGPDQQTPDIASVVQQIVNRSGWASGNSLVIIITGTGERVAEAYDGESNAAPLLHVEYSVGSNTSPAASFTYSCTDLTCDFSDTSTDPDGTVMTRSWDFGDGAMATAQTATHTYAATGDYTVTLTVTDNDGATGTTASQVVTVTEPPVPNTPPTASFTYSCTDLTCDFSDTSTDPDGTVMTRSWDFGDGATSADPTSTHSYASAGDYTVTLAVIDNDGAPGTTSQVVTVTEPAAPVTVAEISPNTVAAGSAIDVVITGSGFVPGASPNIENGNGPPPNVSNVLVVDANTITATVTTKNGGPRRDRLWDVQVTNPDGTSGVLVAGFTVTP
jgi:PKD repeat protein